MTDWAAWGTSVGTLALAGVTLTAVRSSNRAARVAERSLLAGQRPVLAPSRPGEPAGQIQFAGGEVFEVSSGRALVREQQAVFYLAMPLRNVGAGMATLRGYRLEAQTAEEVARDPSGRARHRRGDPAPEPGTFAEQQRDVYIPAGDVGFWQAALRDPHAELYGAVQAAVRGDGRLTVDLLYTDHEAGQPTITRFVLLPEGSEQWRCDVARHWTL
jgi:hypothetical protein